MWAMYRQEPLPACHTPTTPALHGAPPGGQRHWVHLHPLHCHAHCLGLQIQDYQSEIYALRERVDQLVYTLDAMTEDTIPASKMAGTQTAFDQLLGSGPLLSRTAGDAEGCGGLWRAVKGCGGL